MSVVIEDINERILRTLLRREKNRNMLPAGYTLPPQNPYTFSEAIVVWERGGWSLSVMVGYVRDHPEKNQIVLEKGKHVKGESFESQKFYIKSEDDWKGIKAAVEKLWPELIDTASGEQIDKAVTMAMADLKLLDLVAKYPNLLSTLPEDAELLSLPGDQKKALKQLLESSGVIAVAAIEKLSEQPAKDIAEFVEILKNVRLATVNALVTSITSKLAFIKKFEKVVLDETSYERRGPDSVHNLLSANPWIVDRNFVVLHSDETLNNILAAESGEVLQNSDGKIRPDFVCLVEETNGPGNEKMVIIEIKRPGIKISMKHVAQVLGYKVILQQKSGTTIKDYQVYLIGSDIEPTLLQNPLTASGVHTLTYTDFISGARKFYSEYLDIVQKNPFSV